MFDIGWSELLVIGVVALIAIGPKELPGVLRTVGQWMAQDPPHGRRVPGPVPRSDARGRDGRPQEAGRRDDRRRPRATPTSIRSATCARSIESTHRPIKPARQAGRRPSASPSAGDGAPPRRARPRRSRRRARAAWRRRADAAPSRRSRREPRRAEPPRPRRAKPDAGASRMSREDDEKEIEATKAPLMEHLIELRSRLIKALIAFVVAFVVCFFFAKQIYNILVWPFVWVAGRGELQVHLHRAARIFHHPAQARDVRRGLHLVPGDRGADLHVRRARPLPQRAPGLPAVSGRDAVLLRCSARWWSISWSCRCWCASRSACSRLAGEGAGRDRAAAQGRRISVADDEADPRLRHRLPAAGDPDAARPHRHHHLAAAAARSGAISSSAPS